MISKVSLATALALVVQEAYAQCSPVTSQATYGATTSVTVSAATRATITDPAGAPQDITILPCAEATVGSSGTVNINGGTATLSGTFVPTDARRATANVIGPATIPTATYASISIYASQSLELASVSNVEINMDPAATLSVQGYQVGVTANGENIRLEYDAYGGYVDFAGENSVGYIALSGVSNEEYFVDIHDNARAFLMGENYAAFAHEGAIVDVGGFALTCRAVEEASCIGQSSYATLIANGNGYAEVNGGSNNQVIVSQLGSGLVGGSENTGVVSIGGNLRVVNTGRANVEPGGIATVYGYVSQVTVSASATATMFARATVTAAPGAFLSVISTQTEIVSIGESDGYTIFEARAIPSAGGNEEARRAKRAQPTGRCSTGSRLCPNLRGAYGCVDVQTDIFNCGGCALNSEAGQDCTQIYDGAVSCLRGVCVKL